MFQRSYPLSRERAATRRAAVTLSLITAAVAAAACGDGSGAAGGTGDGKEQAATLAAACTSVDTTPVTLAVRDFIATAVPTPQRFLSLAGTDSAVPDDGFKVLQGKGPTFFYTADSAAQSKLRDKLAMDGPYASLLIIYDGKTESEEGRLVEVRLRGEYVGSEADGKKLPTKRYSVRCDSTGWAIASSAQDPG